MESAARTYDSQLLQRKLSAIGRARAGRIRTRAGAMQYGTAGRDGEHSVGQRGVTIDNKRVTRHVLRRPQQRDRGSGGGIPAAAVAQLAEREPAIGPLWLRRHGVRSPAIADCK